MSDQMAARATLAQDPGFRSRVRAAMVDFALTIKDGTSTYRATAQRVLEGQAAWTDAVAWATAMRLPSAALPAPDDATLTTAVQAVLTTYAKASS